MRSKEQHFSITELVSPSPKDHHRYHIQCEIESYYSPDSHECSKRNCFARDIPADSLVSNREGITLVSLDSTLTEANITNLALDRLRTLNDYILFYTQKSLYLDYLMSERKRNNHVIVILRDTEHLDETHACEQICGILLMISDDNEKNNISIEKNYKKVKGIFQDQNSMFVQLQQMIVDIEHQVAQTMGNIFSTFNRKEKSLRDLKSEFAPFMWCHVFKILIKAMPQTLEARQQMLDEYRSYYAENARQLSIIDEFERDYHADHAIRWYTKSCFLFRSLNQALRTENMEVLYTFRSFIVDLCTRLEAGHVKQNITRVYRGGQMSRDEIENYSVGTLVASNGFLSTSRNLAVAQRFISLDSITERSPSQSRDEPIQFVLFEIDISNDRSADVIWADISTQSVFPDEEEVLFDLGTTFEIVEINYDDQHCFWHIQMRLSEEVLPLKREYEDYIHQLMKETNATLLFGILLFDMGEYEQSSKYFQRLLRQVTDDHEDRANIYYSIARVYRFTDQHEKALEQLHHAEQLQRAKLPQSNFDLARTLSGIASVYYELHDYQQELLYYQESMAILQQILPEHHIEIARNFNRLGFAYTNQQNYAKALEHLTKSLSIYNEIVPDPHPGPAQVLFNMGVVYWALGNINQSLDCYKNALEMREKTLPNDHPHIAQSCFRISVVYKEQQQYESALKFAQRALSIYEKKLPQGHRSIHEVREFIESMRNNLTIQ